MNVSTFLVVLILWILIGLLVNGWQSSKNPFTDKFNYSEKSNLILDLILGPLGPIWFLIYLLFIHKEDDDNDNFNY